MLPRCYDRNTRILTMSEPIQDEAKHVTFLKLFGEPNLARKHLARNASD
jgi:hypothetical protein